MREYKAKWFSSGKKGAGWYITICENGEERQYLWCSSREQAERNADTLQGRVTRTLDTLTRNSEVKRRALQMGG